MPAAAQVATAGAVGAHGDVFHHQGAIVHIQSAPLSHADLAGGILLPYVACGGKDAGAIEVQSAAVAKTAKRARRARGGRVPLPSVTHRGKGACEAHKSAAAQAVIGLAGDVVGDGVAGQRDGGAALNVESAAAPSAVGTGDVAAHGIADHLYRANVEQRHPAAASGQRLCGCVAGGVGQNPVLIEGDVRIMREQDAAAHAPLECTPPVVLDKVAGEERLAVLADVHAAAPALIVLRRAIALDQVGVERDRAALVDVHAAALAIAAAGGVGQHPVRPQGRPVAVLQRDAAAITLIGGGGVILEDIVDHLRLAAGEHQPAAAAALTLAGDIAGERVVLDQGRVAIDHHPAARAVVKRVRRGDVAGKGVGEHLRRAIKQIEAAAIAAVACARRGRVVVDGVVFQHRVIGADQRHPAAIAVLDRSPRTRHGSDVTVDLRVTQRHGGPVQQDAAAHSPMVAADVAAAGEAVVLVNVAAADHRAHVRPGVETAAGIIAASVIHIAGQLADVLAHAAGQVQGLDSGRDARAAQIEHAPLPARVEHGGVGVGVPGAKVEIVAAAQGERLVQIGDLAVPAARVHVETAAGHLHLAGDEGGGVDGRLDAGVGNHAAPFHQADAAGLQFQTGLRFRGGLVSPRDDGVGDGVRQRKGRGGGGAGGEGQRYAVAIDDGSQIADDAAAPAGVVQRASALAGRHCERPLVDVQRVGQDDVVDVERGHGEAQRVGQRLIQPHHHAVGLLGQRHPGLEELVGAAVWPRAAWPGIALEIVGQAGVGTRILGRRTVGEVIVARRWVHKGRVAAEGIVVGKRTGAFVLGIHVVPQAVTDVDLLATVDVDADRLGGDDAAA